ncbi:hypothetical protein BDQ17DRAFT_1390109 [Cyathus striatus]|nr:hypothetical protein BDQ17DRAFT_1390109 [Cyathus striatus]
MSTAKARTAHAKAILGPELHDKLANTKVLLVGAGGIGCELLKNIVLTGFGHITLLDLDTIDLSNLNRQFLFKKKDVKQSKALIAAQTAGPFNPNVRITPIHGNIKEPQYDIQWFQQFDIVLNALDNLDARRHVNKMCMAADVPLVESGTAGYLGQVQPLLKDRTECFDCVPKPTPKTFPVCTIRSTPSQPIHCIVWSKSYLMGQLFGEDEEEAAGELDEAEKQGENAQEIAALRREAQAFRAVRSALRHSPTLSANTSISAAELAFTKVFQSDIQNLLSMSDMWRTRSPPVPLDFRAIMDGSFDLKKEKERVAREVKGLRKGGRVNGALGVEVEQEKGNTEVGMAKLKEAEERVKEQVNGGYDKKQTGVGTSANVAGLKDQKALTLKDNLELFVSSANRLATRLQSGEDTISFDKDDADTLDFVTAASNLRSAAYGIDGKTRWEVKEMAGNIIPAIATTNAIISGLIVLQALHVLRKSYNQLRNVHLQFKPAVPLSTITLSPPNPQCGVCRDTYDLVLCDTARTTLGQIVKGIMGDDEREVSVFEDKRMLSDPDWEDNIERTLESLNDKPNHPIDAPPFILPSPLPKPPARVKPPPRSVSPPPTGAAAPTTPKRSINIIEDENGVIEIDPTPRKKPRIDTAEGNMKRKLDELENGEGSPAKKRKLEENGVVILDGPDDQVEYIVVDD